MLISNNASEQYSQLICRVQKLMSEIPKTDTFNQLQNCSKRLERIKQGLGKVQKQKRKELRITLKKCQQLIHKKTLLFSKRCQERKSSQDQQKQSASKSKTLKYSKSMENINPQYLKLVRQKSQQSTPQKKQIKNSKNNFFDRIQQSIQLQKTQAQLYDNKKTLLRLGLQDRQLSFEKQAVMKIKQKSLQIQEYKVRVKYLQETNQQLKNRLINQQRRQQDYISDLRKHLDKLNSQLDSNIRQRNRLKQDLYKTQDLCQVYKKNIKKLEQENSRLQKDKNKQKQAQILSIRDRAIKKQLETLSQQQKYIRQMENLIDSQRDEKVLIKQKLNHLEKKTAQLEQINQLAYTQKQKAYELLQVKQEEIQGLTKQLLIISNQKKETDFELSELRAIIVDLNNQIKVISKQKQADLQRKVYNLKQIRQILIS